MLVQMLSADEAKAFTRNDTASGTFMLKPVNQIYASLNLLFLM